MLAMSLPDRSASDDDLSRRLVELAVLAARGAAELVRSRLEPATVGAKSSTTDLVTDVDRAAEDYLVRLLLQHRPGDAILGEESGAHGRSDADGVRWVIDPIDGTVNFVLGLPVFAVSVAAQVGGITVAGCVVDVVRDEVFSARRGHGSTVGLGVHARPLRGPRSVALGDAVVATGFSYDAAARARQGAVIAAVLGRIGNVRRLGSAALDLCYLADGRVDAYYEAGTREWDRAAGILIATEAGVRVGGVGGSTLHACTAAAGPELVDSFVELLAEAGAHAVLGESAPVSGSCVPPAPSPWPQ